MSETLQERLRWLSRHIVMTADKDCLTGAADELDRLHADRAPHEKDFWAIAEQRDRFGAERDALAVQNERLREALRLAYDAMRAPLDDWKGTLENRAMAAYHAALAATEKKP